jgi:hypothetical protein
MSDDSDISNKTRIFKAVTTQTESSNITWTVQYQTDGKPNFVGVHSTIGLKCVFSSQSNDLAIIDAQTGNISIVIPLKDESVSTLLNLIIHQLNCSSKKLIDELIGTLDCPVSTGSCSCSNDSNTDTDSSNGISGNGNGNGNGNSGNGNGDKCTCDPKPNTTECPPNIFKHQHQKKTKS